MTGKDEKMARTPEMLRTYCRVLYLVNGELRHNILGPLTDRSQDDVSMLEDFMTSPAGSPSPRGVFIEGAGFVESEIASGIQFMSHTTLIQQYLGTMLRTTDYATLSGNPLPCVRMQT